MALTSTRRSAGGDTTRRRGGNGGGAATPEGEGPASGTATPRKAPPAPAASTIAPSAPVKAKALSSTSTSQPATAGGGGGIPLMGLERKVGGSIGSSNGHSARSPLVLLLALAALVLYLSVPALKELRAMVMFRHGRGMTEAQVQKVVIQTLDQREKEQAAAAAGMKRRWGVGSGTKGNVVIGKEEVREAFRALMKEEGAAIVAATLPPPPPATPVVVAVQQDEAAVRKEIQAEVARQLRAYGPAGHPPSEEDRIKAAARGAVP